MEKPTVFDLVAKAAAETGARLILIGGFAVNEYGYARNTQDVDFLATDEDYQKLAGVLSASGYEESAKTKVFAKQTVKGMDGLPADFLFVDPETIDRMWRDGRDVTVSGHRFRICSLLHLIALKLHAIKQGSKDRAWKDIPDILNLIRANGMDAGSPDLKSVCQKFGPEGIYHEILKLSKAGQHG